MDTVVTHRIDGKDTTPASPADQASFDKLAAAEPEMLLGQLIDLLQYTPLHDKHMRAFRTLLDMTRERFSKKTDDYVRGTIILLGLQGHTVGTPYDIEINRGYVGPEYRNTEAKHELLGFVRELVDRGYSSRSSLLTALGQTFRALTGRSREPAAAGSPHQQAILLNFSK